MMLETALVAARDRKRLGEIAAIAIRFGLDDLLRRLGLAGLPMLRRRPGMAAEAAGLSPPARLRQALEALGPSFVKLGQILSTRADLLPPDWIAELATLQSAVAPRPWEEIRAQAEEDLGAAPEAVFAAFDPAPLAAGSVAQVHRARLKDGTAVVVKLRRPGIRPLVEADLRLLSHLAGLVERNRPEIARYRPREILHQLGTAMGEELDLAAEGRNCEAVAANLADMAEIAIPRIHAQWSAERLLVQDYVEGIAPDPTAIAAAGLDGRLLAERGAAAFLHMALVDGVFHADPHPGNLRALPGNRVAFIDFGMVGRIGQRRRDQLLALVAAIVEGRGEAVGMLLLDWAGAAADIDIGRLDAACDGFVARHGTAPLRLGDAISDFMALAREHDLTVPADLALLFKALLTADGVMRGLDPGFDAVSVAAPIAARQMRARHGLEALRARGQAAARDLLDLSGEVPALLRLLALRLRQGRIAADIEIKGLDRLGADIGRAAGRIGVALVTAAFAVGLAPRMLDDGPVLFGVPVTAWAGMAVVAGGLAWLLLTRRR